LWWIDDDERVGDSGGGAMIGEGEEDLLEVGEEFWRVIGTWWS
jgi:hypothetical protein